MIGLNREEEEKKLYTYNALLSLKKNVRKERVNYILEFKLRLANRVLPGLNRFGALKILNFQT